MLQRPSASAARTLVQPDKQAEKERQQRLIETIAELCVDPRNLDKLARLSLLKVDEPHIRAGIDRCLGSLKDRHIVDSPDDFRAIYNCLFEMENPHAQYAIDQFEQKLCRLTPPYEKMKSLAYFYGLAAVESSNAAKKAPSNRIIAVQHAAKQKHLQYINQITDSYNITGSILTDLKEHYNDPLHAELTKQVCDKIRFLNELNSLPVSNDPAVAIKQFIQLTKVPSEKYPAAIRTRIDQWVDEYIKAMPTHFEFLMQEIVELKAIYLDAIDQKSPNAQYGLLRLESKIRELPEAKTNYALLYLRAMSEHIQLAQQIDAKQNAKANSEVFTEFLPILGRATHPYALILYRDILEKRADYLKKSDPLKAANDYKHLSQLESDGSSALLKAADLEAQYANTVDDAIADYEDVLITAVTRKDYALAENIVTRLSMVRDRFSKENDACDQKVKEAIKILSEDEGYQAKQAAAAKQAETKRQQKLDVTITELCSNPQNLGKLVELSLSKTDEPHIRAGIDRCLEKVEKFSDSFWDDICRCFFETENPHAEYVMAQFERKLCAGASTEAGAQSLLDFYYLTIKQSDKFTGETPSIRVAAIRNATERKLIQQADQMADVCSFKLTGLSYLEKDVSASNAELAKQVCDKIKFTGELPLMNDGNINIQDFVQLAKTPSEKYPTAVHRRIDKWVERYIKTNHPEFLKQEAKQVDIIYEDALNQQSPNVQNAQYGLLHLESKTRELPQAKTNVSLMRLALMSEHIQILQWQQEKDAAKADQKTENAAVKTFIIHSSQFAEKESLNRPIQQYLQTQADRSPSPENRSLARQALNANDYYHAKREKQSSAILKQAEKHSLLAVHHVARQHRDHTILRRKVPEIRRALCQFARFLVLAAASQPLPDDMKPLISEAKEFIHSRAATARCPYQTFALWLESFVEGRLPNLPLQHDVNPDALILGEIRNVTGNARELWQRLYKTAVAQTFGIADQDQWERSLPVYGDASRSASSYAASASLAAMVVASSSETERLLPLPEPSAPPAAMIYPDLYATLPSASAAAGPPQPLPHAVARQPRQ
jgi:hypothetical protein